MGKKRSYYNIPIDMLAQKFEVPEDLLLRELLEERAREGSPLSDLTFLKTRGIDPMPRDKAVAVMTCIAAIAERVKGDLVNPLDLLG